MKTSIKSLAIFAFVSALAFGQTAISTTTLGAAITSASQTNITLASTSTMLNAGPANLVNTVLYVDREFMWVLTVVDSTHVTVQRGKGIGASTRRESHVNGAKVYFANTTTSNSVTIPAASYFTGQSAELFEQTGACTATNELALPKIYLYTGNIWDCKNGSSGSQWILVGNGTGGQAGSEIRGFCTGSLGSAETEFLNSAACSGATTSTARYLVTTPGTIANLYVVAGTNVSGGASKDVLTVYKNGSATTITCTFATGGAATTCSDTSHAVTTVAGDVISFQFVTASLDTGANIGAAVGIY